MTWNRSLFSVVAVSLSLLSSYNFCETSSSDTPEKIFTRIYETKGWGSSIHGSGSSKDATMQYRVFLQKFLKSRNIHSVVDIGCGDWCFSHLIDWSGISYSGYDVVKNIILQNEAKYSKSNIKFVHADCLSIDLPQAELLICKEFCQHLPNAEIKKFLSKIRMFTYCLFIDDVDGKTLTSENRDIAMGGWRCIDLTKPPFNLQAVKVMNYLVDGHTKQVLLVRN
jgi:hypothetical protein